MITPVAVHRRISGEHVKDAAGRHRPDKLVGVGLTLLAVLVTGIVVLVFDVVAGPDDGTRDVGGAWSRAILRRPPASLCR